MADNIDLARKNIFFYWNTNFYCKKIIKQPNEYLWIYFLELLVFYAFFFSMRHYLFDYFLKLKYM